MPRLTIADADGRSSLSLLLWSSGFGAEVEVEMEVEGGRDGWMEGGVTSRAAERRERSAVSKTRTALPNGHMTGVNWVWQQGVAPIRPWTEWDPG